MKVETKFDPDEKVMCNGERFVIETIVIASDERYYHCRSLDEEDSYISLYEERMEKIQNE